MAGNGTPHEGVDNILVNAYTGLRVILYTNTPDSLDRNTELADLIEPSALDSGLNANGYAFIALTGTWNSTSSLITYSHPGNPIFENTGLLEDWETVTGAAITDGTFCLHFDDFPPVTLPVGGQLPIDISSMTT